MVPQFSRSEVSEDYIMMQVAEKLNASKLQISIK